MIEASGCLFLAMDTGRVMLQQRSGTGSHPHTWAFFGGKGEKNESPFEALLRELEEEIGALPTIHRVFPIHTFTSPDQNFLYHSYVITVYEEFIPKLNSESEGFCWCAIGRWPKPLHPGVRAQLMNPEIRKKIKTISATQVAKDGLDWLDTLNSSVTN